MQNGTEKPYQVETEPTTGLNKAETHPLFRLQDQYVFFPKTLAPEQMAAIAEHLQTCSFCRRMQELLREKPEMLVLWNNPSLKEYVA